MAQVGNFTVNLDSVFPSLVFNSMTTTAGSQLISFNATSTDLNLNTCRYTITNALGAVDSTNNNVSYTCNTIGTASTSAYGSYNLTLTTSDLAGNLNTTVVAFSTSPSSGGTTTGGGGGGQVVIVNNNPNATWSMEGERGSVSYQWSMNRNVKRDGTLRFKNLGSSAIDLSLTVKGSLAPYVKLQRTTISLPLAKDLETRSDFFVEIPPTVANGVYTANIEARDIQGNLGFVSVEVTVNDNISNKLFASRPVGSGSIPYFIIVLLVGALAGFGSYFVFLKKLEFGLAVALIIGLLSGIVSLYFV